MSPATGPALRPELNRLLVLDPDTSTLLDREVRDLPAMLEPGDLLVVNDAATLPASLTGRTARGEPIELRLVSFLDSGANGTRWRAVSFGEGDWRTPTESRGRAPALTRGDTVELAKGLVATVTGVHRSTYRLLEIRFDESGARLWRRLYAAASPIQYSHLAGEVALDAFQTAYGTRPWSVEMPSAGRPLSWRLLLAARRRGVEIASITHAAGISSTGDPVIDAALPLPERYEIPQPTVEAIAQTRARGGRVIAVGTSVVRALEGRRADVGRLTAGSGTTDLVITPGFVPRVVDAILTGVHDPTESHFDLLHAFARPGDLLAAYRHAVQQGYRGHEFGDSMLILGT